MVAVLIIAGAAVILPVVIRLLLEFEKTYLDENRKRNKVAIVGGSLSSGS